MEIAREHIMDRFSKRTNNEDAWVKVARNLSQQIKQKKVPNQSWYKPVIENNKIIGYFCGYGVAVNTVLASDMIPHGVRI